MAYRAEQKKQFGQSEKVQEKIYRKEDKRENLQETSQEIARLQTPKEAEEDTQLNFFDQKLLSKEAKQEYTLVGQVFETY